MSDPRGWRALITGGAVRVGHALALACADSGMDVAVHYRRSAAGAGRTVAECRERGVRAVAIGGDLADAEGCRRVVAEAEAALGGIDALVNNAASFVAAPVSETTEAIWDEVLDVNLKAAFFCAQAVAPGMRARGFGRIVTMADAAGLEAWPHFAAHAIAKGGVVTLTQVLAQALGPEVLVNAISPGSVLMPDGSTPELVAAAGRRAILGRVGEPQDVAEALLYLLRADYVTGHTLVVDGGRLVRR